MPSTAEESLCSYSQITHVPIPGIAIVWASDELAQPVSVPLSIRILSSIRPYPRSLIPWCFSSTVAMPTMHKVEGDIRENHKGKKPNMMGCCLSKILIVLRSAVQGSQGLSIARQLERGRPSMKG
jgi:hypothetical protein